MPIKYSDNSKRVVLGWTYPKKRNKNILLNKSEPSQINEEILKVLEEIILAWRREIHIST